MKQVLAFKCEYCGILKKTATIGSRHERSCIKNPKGQNCFKCICRNTQIDFCKKRKCKCTRAVSADCEYFTLTPEEILLTL